LNLNKIEHAAIVQGAAQFCKYDTCLYQMIPKRRFLRDKVYKKDS